MSPDKPLILAVPKGRILEELLPIMERAGIVPEDGFFDSKNRSLQFKTNHKDLEIIRVRSFDAATFVAFGAAQIGIAGDDVLGEFDYSELYAPLDLDIGHCRLSVAMPTTCDESPSPSHWSHVTIATKYPHLTQKHFAERGIHAECIKLNGAMELAPRLGLANRIVDLVSSGDTLKANGLKEVHKIMDISSKFIVNRVAMKTQPKPIFHWLHELQKAIEE